MPIELKRTLTLRLDSKLYQQFVQAEQLNHLTLNEVLRHRLESVEIKPRCRNLNQQTRALHQIHHRGLLPETEALIEALANTRDLLGQVSLNVEEVVR